MPKRIYLLWIAIIGLIPILVILRQNEASRRTTQLSQHEFMQKVENDLIVHATITLDRESPYLRDVRGRYWKADAQGRTEVPFYAQVYLTDRTLQELLSTPEFSAKRPNSVLINLIWSLGPILLVALVIYFVFIRQLRNLANQSQPSRAQLESKEVERSA